MSAEDDATLEDLKAARAGAARLLRKALTDPKAAGGKPNTNAANSVDHMGYIRELRMTIADLDVKTDAAEGAWETISEVDT